MIEALFLGTGPAQIGVIGNGCGIQGPGQWVSYGQGSVVDVVVGSSVGSEHLPVIDATIADVNQAVGGYFTVRRVTSNAAAPKPGRHEIVVFEVDQNTQQSECGFAGTACFKCTSAELPLLDRCRVIVRDDLTFSPGTVHVHEIVHALGLCHVSGRISSLDEALMASPQRGTSNALIAAELEAIAAVYRSNLTPGARRSDFVAAGLVD